MLMNYWNDYIYNKVSALEIITLIPSPKYLGTIHKLRWQKEVGCPSNVNPTFNKPIQYCQPIGGQKPKKLVNVVYE